MAGNILACGQGVGGIAVQQQVLESLARGGQDAARRVALGNIIGDGLHQVAFAGAGLAADDEGVALGVVAPGHLARRFQGEEIFGVGQKAVEVELRVKGEGQALAGQAAALRGPVGRAGNPSAVVASAFSIAFGQHAARTSALAL